MGVVTEIHVGEGDEGLFAFLGSLFRQNQQILRGIQHLTDPVGGGGGLADHHEHPVDGHDALQNHIEVGQKCQNHAGLHDTAVDPDGTYIHNQCQTDVQAQLHEGAGEGHKCAGFHIAFGHGLVVAQKPPLFVFGFGQGLHHPDAGDVFPHGPDHIIQPPLHLIVQGDSLFGDGDDHAQQNGHQAAKDAAEHRVHGHGHHNAAGQDNGGPDT